MFGNGTAHLVGTLCYLYFLRGFSSFCHFSSISSRPFKPLRFPFLVPLAWLTAKRGGAASQWWEGTGGIRVYLGPLSGLRSLVPAPCHPRSVCSSPPFFVLVRGAVGRDCVLRPTPYNKKQTLRSEPVPRPSLQLPNATLPKLASYQLASYKPPPAVLSSLGHLPLSVVAFRLCCLCLVVHLF